MIKGIIFDLDGTLFDSMRIWNDVGINYLKSIGVTPPNDLHNIVKSLSLFEAAEYFISEFNLKKTPKIIMEEITQMLADFYENEVDMKPGAAELLKCFKNKGIKMCIATATDKLLVKKGLKKHCVDDYFEDIITCETVGYGKDKPYIFREALKAINVEKKDAVVFEDSIHALKTAKADGFKTVGVYDESEPLQEKVKLYSDYYFKSLSDYEYISRIIL